MKLLQAKLAKYTAPQEAKALGIYPYFRAISSEQESEVIINGNKVLMFGSNCYSGLVNDPRIKEAAIEATRKYGTGCAGSPFLNGTLDLHKKLEARIAEYIGKEDVMIYSTGFGVNLGVVSTLTGREDYIIWDEFYQALWQRELPEICLPEGVTLRPLTQEDVAFVVANYHNPGAYESHIRARIDEGMIGAEVNGRLAGFIGVHQEGCMGLLEILPEYRRLGLGRVLESAIIRQQVGRGRLPYGHVRTGNAASIALQKKMGMDFLDRKVYWLFPD